MRVLPAVISLELESTERGDVLAVDFKQYNFIASEYLTCNVLHKELQLTTIDMCELHKHITAEYRWRVLLKN